MSCLEECSFRRHCGCMYAAEAHNDVNGLAGIFVIQGHIKTVRAMEYHWR